MTMIESVHHHFVVVGVYSYYGDEAIVLPPNDLVIVESHHYDQESYVDLGRLVVVVVAVVEDAQCLEKR